MTTFDLFGANSLNQIQDESSPIDFNDIVGSLTITITSLIPWAVNATFSDSSYRAPAGALITNLDIDYTKNAKFMQGKYIQVIFVIDPNNAPYATFIPSSTVNPDGTGGAVNYCLTTDAAFGKAIFRNLKRDSDLQIRALLKYSPRAPKQRATFNLGIRFTDPNNGHIQTDIFFDPQVPNDGS